MCVFFLFCFFVAGVVAFFLGFRVWGIGLGGVGF